MYDAAILPSAASTGFSRHKMSFVFQFGLGFFIGIVFLFFSLNAYAATRQLVFDSVQDDRVTGYKLYYGESESSDTTDFDINNQSSTIVDLGNTTTYDLPDLKEGATYYFAATAYDGINESAYSDVLFYTVPVSDVTTYTITASAEAGGGITPSGDVSVNHGDSLKFTITANSGYEINQVLVNGKTEGAVSTYTFTNVISDATISASFKSIVTSDPEPMTHIVEMGEVSVNHQWQRVHFEGTFTDPVVVAKPASLNDPDPAVVRIRNVGETGFEVRIHEWDYLDGVHGYEQVSYIVMEKGSYVLNGPEGTPIVIEAGTFKADGKSFRFNAFSSAFVKRPVVIASVTSADQSNAVTGRMRNVSLTGFEYFLQREERNRGKHNPETVSFIACEPFYGVLNRLAMEVGRTGNKVNHNFHYLSYSQNFSKIPYFLADMQTSNDMDTANIRRRNETREGVEIQISEEKSRDSEISHGNENVGYIIIENLSY